MDEDKQHFKENGPPVVFAGKKQSSVSKTLLFLSVLFALATVALAVVLAVTVLKVKRDDDKGSATVSGSQIQSQTERPKTDDDVCLTEGCVLAAARVRSRMDPSVNPCDDFFEFACGSWLRQNVIPEDKSSYHTASEVRDAVSIKMKSARVRSRIDLSVNPCDDFFHFACGSWLKEHVIPEDKSSYRTFTQIADDVSVKLKYLLEEENKPSEPKVIRKAKDFYKGCVNEAKIEELGTEFILKYMEGFGGWPILGSHNGGNWNENSYNLEDLMKSMRNDSVYLPLVNMLVFQDVKNPSKNILMMDQPSLGMPSRDYYLKERNDKVLMAYQKMIKDMAIEFGADKATAETDAKNMVDLERELANITVRREDRRDPIKLYNKMRVGDLSKHFTGFDWQKFIKGTFDLIDLKIDENEPVIVAVPAYFEKLMGIVHKYRSRTVVNYVIWRLISGTTFYLPSKFIDIKMEYQKVLDGRASRAPRWRSCSDNIVNLMPQVTGRLFAQKYFSEDSKQDVENLIENLRTSLKEMITNLDWMEASTKSFAKDKADSIEPRIGYPSWVYNERKLHEKHDLVTVYPDDPLRSLISFGKESVQKNLKKLRVDHDKSEWDMSPAAVNAYYNPATNQINEFWYYPRVDGYADQTFGMIAEAEAFPAAILQPPFYSKDQPAYLNYGGIGFVIGHEMTHGFDDQGRVFDKSGNLNDWWSASDEKKFKQKAQCMIDQYGSYVVPGTRNMTLNGINTQGENIADNGGIKESYKAYAKWLESNGKEKKLPGLPYTSGQLYFLNAAQVWCSKYRDQEKVRRIRIDPHSINMFRVYGPLQNSDEFASAFNCPVNSWMNPRSKCVVW